MKAGRGDRSRRWFSVRVLTAAVLAAAVLPTIGIPARAAPSGKPVVKAPAPRFNDAVAHDESAPLSTLARSAARTAAAKAPQLPKERGVTAADNGFTGDTARQTAPISGAPVTFPIANFEGLSNQDNFDIFGGRVNPPDPVGDVGPNHYVEMVNIVFGVFSKTGTRLLGPMDIGALWTGFAVDDCTDPSGDPIVVYDQLADRWILTQFTTRGLDDPALPFYNCIAISTTGDPTGSYYRYAFTTGFNFPDYPKYGVWSDSYVITSREFGPTIEYGIGVYGLEKNKMLLGQDARSVAFFIDGNDPTLLPLVGDGLLPADLDGKKKPSGKIPLVGTQDDDHVYGAESDALNIWDLSVKWRKRPQASLDFAAQLPVAAFDSNFPCPEPDPLPPDPQRSPGRDCLPQPGFTEAQRAQFLDILSYRQRPTWRLAFRPNNGYDAMVTNQSVEAAPGVAGIRWYEIRRNRRGYSVFQQGTYAPADGVHRWMGSIAQDRRGNMGLGYSVVNATNVFPGIRFTGRFKNDPHGVMGLREGIIANGTGVQTSTNSRWGDYTSMNIDSVDDCTFWYVNEYYTAAGSASAPNGNGWQTRIASFKMPGC